MSKIAFVYPGQGAQKVGMGFDFYNADPLAKSVYDQANEWLDIDVKSLCFEQNDNINITEYTQPALVTTCLAMTEVIQSMGVRPSVTAGLSLGEYAAIAVAGGMSYEQAIKIVRQRGIYMQEAVPEGEGAMAAIIGMEETKIEAILERIDGVSIANYNCPGQIVITGLTPSVIKATEELKENGARRAIMLNVSGPFHSPYLTGAGEKLGQLLETVSLQELKIPYVSNVDAEYIYDSSKIKELLARQVATSVRWKQSVENMISNGVDQFVEIGPGKTLTGFIKKINKEVKVYSIQTMDDAKNLVGELVC